jgi:hypothetical protein
VHTEKIHAVVEFGRFFCYVENLSIRFDVLKRNGSREPRSDLQFASVSNGVKGKPTSTKVYAAQKASSSA